VDAFFLLLLDFMGEFMGHYSIFNTLTMSKQVDIVVANIVISLSSFFVALDCMLCL
jgi:hypothetical protein